MTYYKGIYAFRHFMQGKCKKKTVTEIFGYTKLQADAPAKLCEFIQM